MKNIFRMSSKTESEKLGGMTVPKRRHDPAVIQKKFELIAKLLTLVYSLPSGTEAPNYIIMRKIFSIRKEIHDLDLLWRLTDEFYYQEYGVLSSIDWINTRKPWNAAVNTIRYMDLQKDLMAMREKFPEWEFTLSDVRKYSTCKCCDCQKQKLLTAKEEPLLKEEHSSLSASSTEGLD
jgi:hypothetical protein